MNSEIQNTMVAVATLVYLFGMNPMNTPSHHGMYRLGIHLYTLVLGEIVFLKVNHLYLFSGVF